MKFESLLFGTAGIPLSCKGGTTSDGIEQVRNLGLECMELEFVRNVNIKKEKAPPIKELARKNKVVLSCHGQYFINLNSLEPEKVTASKKRILNAAEIANLCGAFSMCFHAAYYMGQEPKGVYERVKSQLKEVIQFLQENSNPIWIRPELTGKETQFGNLQEILKLSTELEQVMPCIDFSHCHARYNGKYNSYEEFYSILAEIERTLGRECLDNLHIHVSGIEYGPKGEKNHLNLEESDLNYKGLIKAWQEFKIKGVIISESPNIEGDALLMKRSYEKDF
ncbi:MAG: TIM barrel protein [Nanoarchaeota archaeon]